MHFLLLFQQGGTPPTFTVTQCALVHSGVLLTATSGAPGSSLKLGISARNAACNAIAALLDNGPANGVLQILDDGGGAGVPVTATAPETGNVLTLHAFQKPAFGAASNGTAVASGVTVGQVLTSETAVYFRGYNSNLVPVFQGLIGEPAQAPNDMQLNETDLVLSGTVTFSSVALSVLEQS